MISPLEIEHLAVKTPQQSFMCATLTISGLTQASIGLYTAELV